MKHLRLTLLASVMALSGCVLVPGQHMNTNGLTPDVNAQGNIVTPQIIAITAQLIQQEQQQADIETALAIKNYVPPKGFTSNPNDYNYHVGVGDTLLINVWNYMSLTNPLQPMPNNPTSSANSNSQQMAMAVDANGTIYYPYVGYIKVVDKTPDQIRQLLTLKLQTLLKDPQVNVTVTGYNSQHVTVIGAVGKPTQLPISNLPLNILEAVDSASPLQCGVYTVSGQTSICANLSKVVLRRNNRKTVVNLNTLLAPNKSSTNWILQNGDLVIVPNNNFNTVYVLGAVLSPGPYYMNNGRMSLEQALGNAHGMSDLSNPEYTYVIRNYRHNPQIYLLDASSPDSYNLASEFMLKPQDAVFVSMSKLATFGEVMSQINQPLTTAVYINSLAK